MLDVELSRASVFSSLSQIYFRNPRWDLVPSGTSFFTMRRVPHSSPSTSLRCWQGYDTTDPWLCDDAMETLCALRPGSLVLWLQRWRGTQFLATALPAGLLRLAQGPDEKGRPQVTIAGTEDLCAFLGASPYTDGFMLVRQGPQRKLHDQPGPTRRVIYAPALGHLEPGCLFLQVRSPSVAGLMDRQMHGKAFPPQRLQAPKSRGQPRDPSQPVTRPRGHLESLRTISLAGDSLVPVTSPPPQPGDQARGSGDAGDAGVLGQTQHLASFSHQAKWNPHPKTWTAPDFVSLFGLALKAEKD